MAAQVREDECGPLTIARGWLWRANLRPFMEMCSSVVEYSFDNSDWDAVQLILSSTDDELPRAAWGTYPLVGAHDRLDIAFARAVGGDEVRIVVTGAADAERQATVAAFLQVCATYEVRAH